ncbi:MAG: HyaD/HybD family hydrogenase maturation endopeptidase [Spirochaetes bacterium]|nr:HyaD/HybD family hydrogenase maturation endopeptidase [Spirochaetota bacterium]
MKKTLILGIGNILQSDEGLGVHIVNELVASGADVPEDVEIFEGGTAGFDLIPMMKGRERIIIVDALKADSEPGSIYRFRPEQVVQRRSTYSLHEGGISEVLETMKLMGYTPEVEFIGIVPEDITTTDIQMSEAVKRSVPKAIELILNAATT